MTRKEQIKEYLRVIGSGDMENIPFDVGFECGVEWADSHPHWISVEDELPQKGDRIIIAQEAFGAFQFITGDFLESKTVADITDFKVKSAAFVGITVNAEAILGRVTHWMRFDQPKKGDEE